MSSLWPALRRLAPALLALPLLAACEGSSLFTAEVGPPSVRQVDAPESAAAGSTIEVAVTARGTRFLTALVVETAGAFESTLTFPVSPPTKVVSRVLLIDIPVEVEDTTLILAITAVDDADQRSEPELVAIRIADLFPPIVDVQVASQSVASGQSVGVQVTATDNVGLQRVGFEVYDRAGVLVHTQSGPASGLSVDTLFSWAVPDTLGPQLLRIRGTALDVEGVRARSDSLVIEIVDASAPEVTILFPEEGSSFPRSRRMQVRARIEDPGGIETVTFEGVAIRRDTLQDTEVVSVFEPRVVSFPQPPALTLPTDTILVRELTPTPFTEDEFVHIVVTATDSVGNVGSDTVRIAAGPEVRLLFPEDGDTVAAGAPLSLGIFATEPNRGIDSVAIQVSGVVDSTFFWRGLAATDSVTRDTLLALPAGVTGALDIVGLAWSRPTETTVPTGRTVRPVRVQITTSGVLDSEPPSVSVQVERGSRMELTEYLTVTVNAKDNGPAGLRRFGVVAWVINADTIAADTVYRATPNLGGVSGTNQDTFRIRLNEFNLDEVRLPLPRDLGLFVAAFAVDTLGNVACAASDTLQTAACRQVATVGGDGFYVPATVPLPQLNITAVAGTSVGLPGLGGQIADAVLDLEGLRLLMSNITENTVEVLSLADTLFDSPIAVGSAPWGLFITDKTGAPDTLIVGNSGGTNISLVGLTPGQETLFEDTQRRILTPSEVLWEVVVAEDENGFDRYVPRFIDFSDRPQFVAQDDSARYLYSTVPTAVRERGTIRLTENRPGFTSPETRILLPAGSIQPAEDIYAFAHIDSLRVVGGGPASNDQIILYDHDVGRPERVIFTPAVAVQLAGDTLSQDPNCSAGGGTTVCGRSDVEYGPGSFALDVLSVTDTTFVAASGDQGTIMFGEGAQEPFSRVFLWHSDLGRLSPNVEIQDQQGNTASNVTGIGLNQNGSFGVARGADRAYYFTDVLRAQGIVGLSPGGSGTALHPDHDQVLETKNAAFSFIGTTGRTIRVINTTHFVDLGQVPIRDNLVGPLRIARPFAGDNDPAWNCTAANPASWDARCVVAKLYGVTGSDRVVLVNVRKRYLSDAVLNGLP